MNKPVDMKDLGPSLRKSQMIALAPMLAGLATGLGLMVLNETPSFLALFLIALGASLTAALTWLQSQMIDLRYFPDIARAHELETPVDSRDMLEKLPKGIVPMGIQQGIFNGVRGIGTDHIWQAGFLECTDHELKTGSTRSCFRGQLIQVQGRSEVPDFICRPKGVRLELKRRSSSRHFRSVANIGTISGDWVLYVKDSASAPDVILFCRSVLENLPKAPAPAKPVCLFSVQGWIQILYASKRDLFSLWRGLLPARNQEKSATDVSEALSWSKGTASMLIRAGHSIF